MSIEDYQNLDLIVFWQGVVLQVLL